MQSIILIRFNCGFWIAVSTIGIQIMGELYEITENSLNRFARRRPRSPSRLRTSCLRNPLDSGVKSLLSRAAYRRVQAQAPAKLATLSDFKEGSCALSLAKKTKITINPPSSQTIFIFFHCNNPSSEGLKSKIKAIIYRSILQRKVPIFRLFPKAS